MFGPFTQSSMSWASLPTEIRLMILEAATEQKPPGWASLASVSKEWQLFIEKRNFCRLKLGLSCLVKFDYFTSFRNRWRRRLIQHICFDVELPEYSCRACKRREAEYVYSEIISKAIFRLFQVLSSWGPKSELERRDLTLELNAHSPSDWKHWFKNYYFTSDNKENQDAASKCTSCHDEKHGWVDGLQIRDPPFPAVRRLFGEIHFNNQDLPRVDIVTGFLIRRQLRRRVAAHSTLKNILGKLPGLECMVYEPWRRWERKDVKGDDQGTN